MPKQKHEIKAYCPKCGEKYSVTENYEWGKARRMPRTCKDCIKTIDAPIGAAGFGRRTGGMIMSCKTFSNRGYTSEKTKRHNTKLELMGRKLRAKWGIKAPVHQWGIPDAAA